MSDDLHRALGAYILGALEGTDREAFEAHLTTCDRCRAELVELAPVPGLLARVDVAELDDHHAPDPSATVQAARAHVESLDRSRRRWRLAATALATAAAVLAIALVALRDDDRAPFDPGETVEFALASDVAVEGRIGVGDRGWGSRVEIDLLGLPADDGYEIWAVGTDGSWELAASFGPTNDGTCRVVGSTSMHADAIARIVITTTDRARELVWAWEEE